jgi:hypothetical protein
MSLQRLAVLAALCGTLVLHGWVAAELVGLGSPGIKNSIAPIESDIPQPTAMAEDDGGGVTVADAEIVDAALPDAGPMPPPVTPLVPTEAASARDPVQDNDETAAPPVEVAGMASVGDPLPDPRPMLPPAMPPAPIASASPPDSVQDNDEVAAMQLPATPPAPIASTETPDPTQNGGAEIAVEVADMRNGGVVLPEPHPTGPPPMRLVSLFRSEPLEENLKPAVRAVEIPNECLVAEICIDDYLWSFYERTPKIDMNKVTERIKATVKKKGKTRIVIKTIAKYVVGDFTWKDPMAAQKAGMSVKDYVIGGMDPGFKLKLYHALRAMDDAGFMPGITSAFRDDYRQSIASGNKAASDSSYHGGSRRGGYGHGLAADLVSVKGETRLERYASSKELWKWIDAHEKELEVGRPYLDRDPPHVGPIDGKEYADKRGVTKPKLAVLAANRRASR